MIMTPRFRLVACLSAALLTLGTPLLAANKARVKLVGAVSAIQAGVPFDVAVQFDIDKGWHIYWQNAGESGQPPKIKWNLPREKPSIL